MNGIDNSSLISGGFHLIATVLDMQIDLPVDITPTLRLEKASDEQIKSIEKLIDNRLFYESEYTEMEGDNKRYNLQSLSPESFRYYVVSWAGRNHEPYQFFYVAKLITPYITSFYNWITTKEYGNGTIRGVGNHPIGTAVFNQGWFRVAKPFNQENLSKLQQLLAIYKKLEAERSQYGDVLKAVEFYDSLKGISPSSPLNILGHFIVIEMLLTHKPNGKEMADSLTHQIKSKMKFLTPRLSMPLDYQSFGEAAIEQIWTSLYSWRSKIAHGDISDFTKAELQKLKTQEKAYSFLESATRNLLVYALEQPELVQDLKPL